MYDPECVRLLELLFFHFSEPSMYAISPKKSLEVPARRKNLASARVPGSQS